MIEFRQVPRGEQQRWERKALSGQLLDETQLPLYTVGWARAPRPTVIRPSDAGLRDAEAKLKAWDANEPVALPGLAHQTGAATVAIHILAFELLRGPGNKIAIQMRATAATGWNYTEEQCLAAQNFAAAVLVHGWAAAVGKSACHPTSYADAVRAIAPGPDSL